MRILGIDPGTARLGWGVVVKESGKLAPAEFGCIETEAGAEPAERLARVQGELEELVRRVQPEVAAVESLFFAKNQTTAMRVSEARGVVLATLARAGLAVYEYTPLQVKQSLTGYGKAEKRQVEMMVMQALGITEKIRPDDTADALAVAVTHAARERMSQKTEDGRRKTEGRTGKLLLKGRG